MYAKQPVKSILDKNLRNFAQQTGNSWVMNLLEMKGC